MSKIFKRGGPARGALACAPELQETVNRLLRKGGGEELAAIRQKSIAVTSGKGGVGKTITAVNLSIYYAKKGLRVGLIDLDPLSDVAALLDLVEAESALEGLPPDLSNSDLEDHLQAVFGNLDLIFPAQKLKTADRRALLAKIYQDLATQLNQRYDLLIFDLPAGSDFEDNLVFLPFMGLVLLVTNPEPTAHATAGAYLKQAFDIYRELTVHLWHNRFTPDSRTGFNTRDVIGNYNRNVPPELQIDEKLRPSVRDFVSIPEDPALNLLRGSPAADVNVLRFLLDTLQYVHEERLAALAAATISSRSFELITYFISRHKKIDSVDGYLGELGEYLRRLLAASIGNDEAASAELFSPQEKQGLRRMLTKLRTDPLRQRLVRVLELLEVKLARLEGRSSLFAVRTAVVPDKAVDREISMLLVEINKLGGREPAIKAQGGLLLFYFSLYKLFQSPTVTDLIGSLVPRRITGKGAAVRDRHRQIRNLLEGEAEYKRRYLRVLKTLHPVVSKQIANIVKVFDLSGLLFRDEKGEIIRSAYVKLLTNFLHDTLYSGLSVVIGFPYRAAANAFQLGANKALAVMGKEVGRCSEVRKSLP